MGLMMKRRWRFEGKLSFRFEGGWMRDEIWVSSWRFEFENREEENGEIIQCCGIWEIFEDKSKMDQRR